MKEILTDLNNLRTAFYQTRKSGGWKGEIKIFEQNLMQELVSIKKELEEETYKTSKGNEFIISERGKTRYIRSVKIRDRVVRRVLCDKILIPQLSPHMIHDNGASLKGKGVTFTRRRLEQHLHEYYRQHGSDGYILLIDFSKYYDNIRHDIIVDKIKKYIKDEYIIKLVKEILDIYKIDVSYLTDRQYEECMDMQFNSLKHNKINKKLLTGEKYMAKSLGIGDQISQILSVFLPTEIDTYCKVVKGIRYYGRYMDDSYIISDDKEFLKTTLKEIELIAKNLGIFINKKKTQIKKIKDYFVFMQIRYKITNTGHLIRRINPKRTTAMRRKIKNLYDKYHAGEVPYEDIEKMYKSWMGTYAKYLSGKSRNNLDVLFKTLYGGTK